MTTRQVFALLKFCQHDSSELRKKLGQSCQVVIQTVRCILFGNV